MLLKTLCYVPYLHFWAWLKMFSLVQVQKRKAYPWGCPSNSCKGFSHRSLPTHQSFSLHKHDFFPGWPYGPPSWWNLAINPCMPPELRLNGKEHRDFMTFTPPAGCKVSHLRAPGAQYYHQKLPKDRLAETTLAACYCTQDRFTHQRSVF